MALRTQVVIPLFFVAVFTSTACYTTTSDSGDSDVSGETDADSDADTDTNIDADTNTDGYIDTYIDTDGTRLMPDREGWLEETARGFQGTWFTLGCDGATITPCEGCPFTNTGKLCFSGDAPRVIDADRDGEPDWTAFWGAVMGIMLCTEDDGSIDHPLGSCPFNPNLAAQMIGVSVTFEAGSYINAPELRIQFFEGDGIPHCFRRISPSDIAGGLTVETLFGDPFIPPFNPVPRHPTPENILSVDFHIPTNADTAIDWHFCITDIRAIMADD